MTAAPQHPTTLSPDDALPPVEPPSGGFIVQLFVLPAVIVLIIVGLWGLFNWLARGGENSQDYIRALQRENVSRWQAAGRLADVLRDARSPLGRQLKGDRAFAGQVAAILRKELAERSTQEEAIELRVYLCRVLGELDVAEGIPVLLEAARSEADGGETDPVALAAISALAVFAGHAPAAEVQRQPQLRETLLDVSRGSDSLLRNVSAFALGVLGGEAPRNRLAEMLQDADANVRFNAATGLARHGDERAIEQLAEMLDPEAAVPQGSSGTGDPEPAGSREQKQMLVLVNALRAIEQLVQANPGAAIEPLRTALARLRVSTHPVAAEKKVQWKAKEVSQKLAALSAGTKSAL